MELILAVVLAAMAAAIVSGHLRVPTELTSSSVSIAFMLVVVLALFSYSPVVGIAGVIFLAVLVFSRNVEKVATFSNVARATNTRRNEYGDLNIYKERPDVIPYESTSSGPRDYKQFSETKPYSLIPNVHEGFTEQQTSYSSFGSEQYATGQYPIDNQRQWSNPYVEEYKFRPSLDTGSNNFQRHGPNMDRKLEALVYQ